MEPPPIANDPAQDRPKSRPRGRWTWWVTSLLLVSGLALLAVAAGGRWAVERWATTPHGDALSLDITIAPGSSLRKLSNELHASGAVSSANSFLLYATLEGKAGALQAGEYQIALPITPEQVLDHLQHGTFQRRLTIPEGWTKREIAREMVRGEWVETEEEWFDLVAEPVEAEVFGADLPHGSEGFCFPDTYFFERGTGARAIHARMLGQFAKIWPSIEPDRRSPPSEKLSTLEVVTLASMIEREARTEEELPLIASVYLNRLKIRMRLQCCATVHYALGEVWDRALTRADLKVDSPYNTYIIYGLPPGPIGNPGQAAIEAVLRPADTPYLYYVYRGDGSHEFTKTYKEHLRAARRFREADPSAEFVGDVPDATR